jgi:hypothetical protein
MLNKDKRLLEEAYLSASGKIPSTPADKEEVEISGEESPENKIEDTKEEPMVISIGGPIEDTGKEEPDHTFSDDKEETWQEHENEEIRMAKTNLFTLSEDSKLIFNALEDGEEIEPWMLQKIAVASEMLCGVAKVVRYYTAKKAAGA